MRVQCEGRIVQQTWLCKSWLSPVAGCLNTSSGTFYCPISDNKLIEWSASDAQLHDIKPLKVTNIIIGIGIKWLLSCISMQVIDHSFCLQLVVLYMVVAFVHETILSSHSLDFK